MTRAVARAVAVTAAALALPALPLRAQEAPGSLRRPRLETRADVIAGRATAVQGALGVVVPLGTYVRGDAVVGGGTVSLGGESRGSARADAVARFLLDPFLERRRGAYGGAGVSAMYTGGDRDRGGGWRAYLVAVAGVEGRPRRGILPSVEVGLGGGTRIGLVLRRAPAAGR